MLCTRQKLSPRTQCVGGSPPPRPLMRCAAKWICIIRSCQNAQTRLHFSIAPLLLDRRRGVPYAPNYLFPVLALLCSFEFPISFVRCAQGCTCEQAKSPPQSKSGAAMQLRFVHLFRASLLPPSRLCMDAPLRLLHESQKTVLDQALPRNRPLQVPTRRRRPPWSYALGPDRIRPNGNPPTHRNPDTKSKFLLSFYRTANSHRGVIQRCPTTYHPRGRNRPPCRGTVAAEAKPV